MSQPFKLQEYLACMLQIPPLSAHDMEKAVKARARGDEWARRLLEERFLPTVVRWVQPYRGRGIKFQTLIEIGNRALLRGLRHLKPGQEVDIEDFLERCVIEDVEGIVFAKK